jgi:hypothetical protein
MHSNLRVKTSREEIFTSIEGDATVRTLGLGQRSMAEDEDGHEGRQGPARGGAGDGGHGSPAEAAHGGGGAGVVEMAAARQGRSCSAGVAAGRAARCVRSYGAEEKEKAGHGGELRCAAMARFPAS